MDVERRLEKYKHLIKSKAYFLWLEAGKPWNRDLEFWLAAENAIRTRLKERCCDTR